MGTLLALQQLQFDPRPRTPESRDEMARLREGVPTPILAHYDHFVAHGKKGVAVARGGVCSECHLRIPVGKLASLTHTDEVLRCDNCCRYLYLPAEEPIGSGEQMSTPPTRATRRSQRTVQHVV
jgi:hypothetical protein